jgi:threonine/homoserine/homoserine lactone efflux protein
VIPEGLAPGAVASLALASALIELTPGPNMTWLAIVAATQGRRIGLAAVLGVSLGLLVIGVAAAMGLAAIVAGTPALYEALRWGGAAYLLWLAWEGWRDGEGLEDGMAADTGATSFRRGFVTNLLNPKAGLFYLSVLPAFVSPVANVIPATLALTIVHVAVATVIHAGIVLLAGAAHPFLSDPSRSRVARRALSAALALVAVWLLFGTAR